MAMPSAVVSDIVESSGAVASRSTERVVYDVLRRPMISVRADR
jgi:hypothetical protein